MKLFTFPITCLPALLCVSCSDPSQSLDKSIEGRWLLDNLDFTFRSGAMVATANSMVYGSYQIIDAQTIRFQRNNKDILLDAMVTVKFPGSDSMIWYRNESGKLVPWLTFRRVKL